MHKKEKQPVCEERNRSRITRHEKKSNSKDPFYCRRRGRKTTNF